MKKVLGIISSPRKMGNTEIMLKEISEHIEPSHQLNLIRLSDFDIRPCKGCYYCLFNEGKCIQEDDFPLVMEAIINSDAIVVGVPTYFLGPNACLKLLLDRGLSFYAHIDRLWGKPSIGFGVAGIEGKEGGVLLGIENFLKLILSEIKRVSIVYGALPGEIFLNEDNKHIAKELGKSLFAPLKVKKNPACPLCGGETFRFMGDNHVKCMLCSNSGTIEMVADQPVFKIFRGDHELFLSKDDTLEHGHWLRSMKARFIEQKDRLKQISIQYRGGDWIKP